MELRKCGENEQQQPTKIKLLVIKRSLFFIMTTEGEHYRYLDYIEYLLVVKIYLSEGMKDSVDLSKTESSEHSLFDQDQCL